MLGPTANLDRYVLEEQPPLADYGEHLPPVFGERYLLQQAALEVSNRLQREADEEHLRNNNGEPIKYAEGTYVLVDYPSTLVGKRPPKKLMLQKRGPMKVIEHNHNEYKVQDCVTKEIDHVHIQRIHPFIYDPRWVDPELISYRDREEYVVEKIIDHVGDKSVMKSQWEFKVRWLGYPPEEDLWLPWKELRNNPKLHKYLADNGLDKLIPKEHRQLHN
jgi:hypothetical protein